MSSGFVKEVPAFERPRASVKTVDERLEAGEPMNSIPPDSGLLHSGGPRKHLTFRQAPNNSVIQHYGSYIVMGTDRLGHLGTGAGASGYSNADAVDIVVGRGANLDPQPFSLDEVSGPPEGFIAGPLPVSDAARIYISSKTNLDKHFGIAVAPRDPHSGKNTHLLSGIGIKADNVRMIARNNIKIVTGRNHGYTGGKEKNSLGGISPQAGTISLIGGNYTGAETKWAGLFSKNGAIQPVSYLQPAIKGDNLVECLNGIYEYCDMINNAVFNMGMYSTGMAVDLIRDVGTGPMAKVALAMRAGLKIPYGLKYTFEARIHGTRQRNKYLEYGGDFHVRSPNVYLT